jgi:hypothetical protein
MNEINIETSGKDEIEIDWEARLLAAKARVLASKARLLASKAKIEGTYFTPQSDVCDCNHDIHPRTVDLRRLRSQAEAINKYKPITEHVINNAKVRPAYGSASGNVVWKKAKKIFSGLFTLGGRTMSVNDASFSLQHSNILGGPQGQVRVAYLLPHAPPCAAYYGRTVVDALGLVFDEYTPNQIQALIHGAKKGVIAGLKHSHCNKCQLSSQEQVYDAHPYMLIVPIMTLLEVKAWTGEPYDALVLVNETETHGKLLANCRACEKREDFDKALELLQDFTFEMAHLKKVRVPGADRHLRNLATKKRSILKQEERILPKSAGPFFC